MRAVLERLSRLKRVTVMIVSGRSIEDLVDRIGLPGLVYAGNHGLEIEGLGLAFVEPTARTLASRLEHLTEDLADRVRNVPGVVLEPKGLTTSLHYRTVAPESWDDAGRGRNGWWRRPAAIRRHVRPLRLGDPSPSSLAQGIGDRPGWLSVSAIGPDRLVFYLGDDQTDEDAFASHPGRRHGQGWQIAPRSTAARYWLPDPDSCCSSSGGWRVTSPCDLEMLRLPRGSVGVETPVGRRFRAGARGA